MYRDEGKPTRNRRGKIIKPAAFQSRATPGEVARVEPNRKWFGEHDINIFSFLTWKMCVLVCYVYILLTIFITPGNTHVITQNDLQKFQSEMGKVMKDPYKVKLFHFNTVFRDVKHIALVKCKPTIGCILN